MTTTFNENLYNSLLETFGENERFDISTLNPKENDYGDKLATALFNQGLIYVHTKHDHSIDALSYVNDIELDNNHIIVRNMYWTKYGQLCISKNGNTAGWYRRTANAGHPIIFDLSINGNEYESMFSINVSTNGPIGKISIALSDGIVYYVADDGEYISTASYLDGIRYAFSTDTGISNMMFEVIENTIDWILDNIKKIAFEMTGYTQME